MVKKPTRGDILLDLVFTDKNWSGMLRSGADLAAATIEVVEFRILRDCSEEIKQDHKPGFQESRLWPFQASAWQNPMY